MIPLRRLGLYGGSFDPVHNGHLILAREALETIGLDRVVFIPAGISPHKLARPPAPPEVRLEMLAAAVADEQGFGWDDREIRRAGPSFAVDTVREMHAEFPSAAIFYFVGDDNLAALHTWKEIDALLAIATLVVFSRSGISGPHRFPVVSRRVDISSTDIRTRVAAGRPVRYLVPDPVLEIISRHRLYRDGPVEINTIEG